ncbi:hypothetical protein CC79DRAFT_566997 [Sarocladium strictum]
MMGDSYALLVVAEPPQSAALEDLQLAFQPTVIAVTERLSRLSEPHPAKTFLDIALPITRVTKEASCQAELHSYLSQVLTGLYQLFHTASSTDLRAPRLETTVIPIYEIQDQINNDYGRSTMDDQGLILPSTIRDLKAFARTPRPWSRIFQVDSPQGDLIYQKLRSVPGSSIASSMHEKVERLPAGIQMYVPPSVRSHTCIIENTPPASDDGSDILQAMDVNIESDALRLEDKVDLTMKLLSHSGVVRVVTRGQPEAPSVVLRFWESVIGARLERVMQETSTGMRTWESTLSDGTLLSLSSPMAPKLASTTAKQKQEHIVATPAVLSS